MNNTNMHIMVKEGREIYGEKSEPCQLTSQNGFTLLELLVAMLLLTIGMFAWMQLQIAAIKVSDASKNLMNAQNKISQEFEQIKTIGYGGIKDSTVLTNASFNYSNLLTGLSSSYQSTGIDSNCNAPATYCVFKGLSSSKRIKNNTVTVKNYYAVKLAVNPGYLSYPEIAQVTATVYWKTGTTLKNMQIATFVGM